jgi:hypothetical protein
MCDTRTSHPDAASSDAAATDRINAEIEYYFSLAKQSGDKRVKRARRWRETELGLAIGAAVLATAAGATVLGTEEYRLLAGFLALGAALTSSLSAALAPEENRQRNLRLAAAYLRVADDARLLRAADLPYMNRGESRAALQALIKAYQDSQVAMVSAEAASRRREPGAAGEG